MPFSTLKEGRARAPLPMLEMLQKQPKGGKQARRLVFLIQLWLQCCPPTPHLEREGWKKMGVVQVTWNDFNIMCCDTRYM